ncbi:MAG: TRAP transporter substrate-binding protein [Candidatus Competibacteraceae bacterium]|nr:TRAP transporter substrate-binding protein [Candidatus Competibacteraceae bacterium]
MAACAASLLATPLLAQSATTLKAADVHPKGYPNVVAVEGLGKKLEKATEGRLKLKMFAGGVLGDEKNLIEQTQIGAIQILRVSAGPLSTVVPDVDALNLPYLFRNPEHMRKFVDGPVGQEMLDKITNTPNSRLVGLAWMDSGSRNVYAKKAIRKPADLQGLKIRVQGNPLFVDAMNAMGGNAISMPFGELYSALQTGVVDGAENNVPSYYSQNHYTVANVFSRTAHTIVPELLLFSRKAWDKLSAEDQALIKKLAREAQMEQRELWDKTVVEDTAKLKEKGVTFVDDVDVQAFIDATAPVREKYGAPYADMIKKIQAIE